MGFTTKAIDIYSSLYIYVDCSTDKLLSEPSLRAFKGLSSWPKLSGPEVSVSPMSTLSAGVSDVGISEDIQTREITTSSRIGVIKLRKSERRLNPGHMCLHFSHLAILIRYKLLTNVNILGT